MPINLKGADELMSDLTRMAQTAGAEAADDALRAGAQVIFDEMRTQATIDPKIRTKNLYKSLKIGHVTKMLKKSRTKRIDLGAYEKENGQIAPHAHLVEYGHGGPAPAPPHPFIRPSFDKKSSDAYEAMKRVLEEALKW